MTADVIRTADLKAAGVPAYRIDVRCRPGGPWQRILPGVVLLVATPPTRAQRVRAALAYAGPDAVVTGVDALLAQGITGLWPPSRVHVLQPAARRRSGDHQVLIERTTRLPQVVRRGDLALAPPARAVLDAARHEPSALRQRHLLATVVESGACTVAELFAELDAGSTRGTATPRSTLRVLARRYGPDQAATTTKWDAHIPLPRCPPDP